MHNLELTEPVARDVRAFSLFSLYLCSTGHFARYVEVALGPAVLRLPILERGEELVLDDRGLLRQVPEERRGK